MNEMRDSPKITGICGNVAIGLPMCECGMGKNLCTSTEDCPCRTSVYATTHDGVQEETTSFKRARARAEQHAREIMAAYDEGPDSGLSDIDYLEMLCRINSDPYEDDSNSHHKQHHVNHHNKDPYHKEDRKHHRHERKVHKHEVH